MYGAHTRTPKGFTKLDLLGKGGCAVVWLCINDSTGEHVAIKQFPKTKGNELNVNSAQEELKINRCFYQSNGKPYDIYSNHPGLKSICKLLDSVEDKGDIWLIYEVCGKPLSKLLYSQKGQFYKGERIYEVKQDEAVYRILQANDCREFKNIITVILQGLSLMKMAGLVHCDLKAENILVDVDFLKQEISSVKIIDFGSSFNFDQVNNKLEITTPEYLPPEILEHMEWKQLNMLGMQYATDQQK